MEQKTVTMDEVTDLHYSPDDNGWYFQEYHTSSRDRISQLFQTQVQAIDSWHKGTIEWHNL